MNMPEVRQTMFGVERQLASRARLNVSYNFRTGVSWLRRAISTLPTATATGPIPASAPSSTSSRSGARASTRCSSAPTSTSPGTAPSLAPTTPLRTRATTATRPSACPPTASRRTSGGRRATTSVTGWDCSRISSSGRDSGWARIFASSRAAPTTSPTDSTPTRTACSPIVRQASAATAPAAGVSSI